MPKGGLLNKFKVVKESTYGVITSITIIIMISLPTNREPGRTASCLPANDINKKIFRRRDARKRAAKSLSGSAATAAVKDEDDKAYL
jgi:hypothetical protein